MVELHRTVLRTAAVKAATAVAVVIGGAASASALELSLPIYCKLGENCFIQQYVDLEPGPGTRDYRCSGATYDGHKGTDFRVKTLADVERGVPVIASAPGEVTGFRDGEPDRLVKSEAERAAVQNKECGNGVVVTHDDGWQTQYCHLREGSIAVEKGTKVERGDQLGLVGYSGNAAFPHVHLSVRKGKETIDPFRGTEGGPVCDLGTTPLWTPQSLAKMDQPASQLLDIGFYDGPVKVSEVEAGTAQGFMPQPTSDALVSWGWAINLKKGDEVIATLVSPLGELARNAITLDRNKAQYLLFAGKRRPAGGWPEGNYHAVFTVLRNGNTVIKSEVPVDLR